MKISHAAAGAGVPWSPPAGLVELGVELPAGTVPSPITTRSGVPGFVATADGEGDDDVGSDEGEAGGLEEEGSDDGPGSDEGAGSLVGAGFEELGSG